MHDCIFGEMVAHVLVSCLSREQMLHLRAVVSKRDLGHNDEEDVENSQRSQENFLMGEL